VEAEHAFLLCIQSGREAWSVERLASIESGLGTWLSQIIILLATVDFIFCISGHLKVSKIEPMAIQKSTGVVVVLSLG
jgi:hypothetical protein